eukprot:6181944-Pleurochrysis_carterae.AAC.3
MDRHTDDQSHRSHPHRLQSGACFNVSQVWDYERGKLRKDLAYQEQDKLMMHDEVRRQIRISCKLRSDLPAFVVPRKVGASLQADAVASSFVHSIRTLSTVGGPQLCTAITYLLVCCTAPQPVLSLSFSRDSELLASGSQDGLLKARRRRARARTRLRVSEGPLVLSCGTQLHAHDRTRLLGIPRREWHPLRTAHCTRAR